MATGETPAIKVDKPSFRTGSPNQHGPETIYWF